MTLLEKRSLHFLKVEGVPAEVLGRSCVYLRPTLPFNCYCDECYDFVYAYCSIYEILIEAVLVAFAVYYCLLVAAFFCRAADE